MHRMVWTVFVFALAAAVSHAARPNPAHATEAEYALLTERVSLEDPGGAELPFPREGEQYACTGQTPGGYRLLCRDAKGTMRYAFLPYRDEWGHSTADTWTHTGDLGENTIRIVTPVPLRPSVLLLPAGTRLRVLAKAHDRWTVAYTCAHIEYDLRVRSRMLELEPQPDQSDDPVDRRIAELEEQMADRQARHLALLERLAELRDDNARMATLLAESARLRSENTALAMEAEEAAKIRAWLQAHEPSANDDAIRSTLPDVLERRTAAARRAVLARMELEPMQALMQRLDLTEAELARLTEDAGRAEADIRALADLLKNGEWLEARLAGQAAIEAAEGVRQGNQTALALQEARHNALSRAVERLRAVRAEDARFQEQLVALEEEIAALEEELVGETAIAE